MGDEDTGTTSELGELSESVEASKPGVSGYLVQLLAAARANSVDAMDRLLQKAESDALAVAPPDGAEYLLFACADVPCAVPLTALREVRPSLPQVVPLPFSPDWLIGIFPLRTELLALVDPAPLLLGRSADHAASWLMPQNARHSLYERRVTAPLVNPLLPTTALLIGEGERVLAWAVTAVGDIVAVQDEQITPADEANLGSIAGTPMLERYVTGVFTPPQSDQSYMILDARLVLDDLLAALEERGQDDG
jgi:chemotaxis signal transduction protein